MARRTLVAAIGLLWMVAGVGCATLDEEAQRRAETHGQLAGLKLGKGELEFAIREYQAALALNESDAEMHFGLAEAYRRKLLFADAERHLLRALELDPGHMESRLNLGAIYLHQGRWEEAIRENTTLVETPTFLSPERALVNRGWAHYMSKRSDAAAEDFRAARARNPRFFIAHLNLGIVLYEQGEVVESVQEFRDALAIIERGSAGETGPMQAQTRYRLAQAYVKLGRRDQAVDELRKASQVGERSEWGRKSKEYLAVLE